MEPTRVTIELDTDELLRQFWAGIQSGIIATNGKTKMPPEVPEEEFEKAIRMAIMAAERDCQASANHAVYTEGYGYGLRYARRRRI
jgi:hypothetical protein